MVKNCALLVDHIIYSCNEEVTNASITVYNDGIHDSLIDLAIETFQVIERMVVQVKINIALDKNDKEMTKEFIKTSVDVGKLMSGVQGNFIFKVFLENFFKSIDFEPKLPFPKVS